MEHNKQFVGIENAARIPGTDHTTQMQIRAMRAPKNKKGKAKSPMFELLAMLGFGQDPTTNYWEREDKGP